MSHDHEHFGEKTAKEQQIDDWLPITSSRNAKWWYSAFHNVTAMVGAGVLSLPYAMSEFGWYFGSSFTRNSNIRLNTQINEMIFRDSDHSFLFCHIGVLGLPYLSCLGSSRCTRCGKWLRCMKWFPVSVSTGTMS